MHAHNNFKDQNNKPSIRQDDKITEGGKKFCTDFAELNFAF